MYVWRRHQSTLPFGSSSAPSTYIPARHHVISVFQSLAPYIANNSAHPFLEVDADVPIVLCGDITQNLQVVSFKKNTFNIDCATWATVGNTCLDLISVECLNYISYFSYHRPAVLPPAILPSPNQDDRVSEFVTQESGITLEKDYYNYCTYFIYCNKYVLKLEQK
jgi:hypothetical protein